MEIVNVHILLAEPLPFTLVWFTRLDNSFVNSAANLEAGLVKVGLNEDSDGLVFFVLDIYLLSDQVECRKLTGLGPSVSL